jgi:hypothetical protein
MICPNITSPEWKALVAKVGENRAWKEFLIYGKIPSADNYQVVADRSLVKPGVAEVFNGSKELSDIGNLDQYNAYVNTIFPDSKVKDVMYHGAMEHLLPADGKFKGYVTYFTTAKSYAETFGFLIKRKVISAVVNVQKPYNSPSELADVPEEVHNTDEYTNPRIIKTQGGNYDAVIGIDAGQKEGSTVAVFEPEQILILGSKQDQESFKRYVAQNPVNQGGVLFRSIRTKSTEQIAAGINKDLIRSQNDLKYTSHIMASVINTLGDIAPNKKLDITPAEAFRTVKGIYSEVADNLKMALNGIINSDQDLADVKASSSYNDILNEFPVLAYVNNYEDMVKAAETYDTIVNNFDKYKDAVVAELARKGIRMVKNAIQTIDSQDVANQEVDNNEDVEISQEEVGERFDRSVFETNPRDTASVRVKALVQTIKTGEYELGIPIYADSNDVFADILYAGSEMALTGFTDTAGKLNAFKASLYKRSDARPYLNDFLTKLNRFEKNNEWDKINDILTFATKAFAQETLLLYKTRKDGNQVTGITDVKVINSNRDTVEDQISRDWLEVHKQSEFFKRSALNELKPNLAKIEKLAKLIEEGKTAVGKDKVVKFKEFFATLGIEFTDKELDYITPRIAKALSKGNDFDVIFAKNNLLDNIYKSYADNAELVFEDNYGFQDEKGSMRKLAILYYEANPGKYKIPSAQTADGKQKYLYILPNYIENKKRQWKLGQTVSVTNSALGRPNKSFWESVKKGISTFIPQYFNGIREQEAGKDGKVRKSLTDKEQTVTMLLKHQENLNVATYINFTLSDKTTTIETKMTKEFFIDNDDQPLGKGRDYFLNEQGELQYSSGLTERAYTAFAAPEISRILATIKHSKDVKLENFDLAGRLFYFIPSLNVNSVLQEFRNDLYSGQMNLDQINAKYSTIVGEAILEDMKQSSEQQINEFLANGIIKQENGNFSFPTSINGFKNTDYINRLRQSGLKGRDLARLMMMDMKLNYINTQVKMIQFLRFDPALAFKSFKDFNKASKFNEISGEDKVKLVSSTWDEFSKRAAALIAPGAQGSYSWKMKNGESYSSSNYQAFTAADVEYKIGDTENTITDAQEYITLNEHIDNLMSEGKISLEIWQLIYDKIQKAGPGGYYELSDKELGYVFTPTKPVHVNDVDEATADAGLNRIDYVKSSRYPLIPQHEAGSERDKLRQWMEQNGIQAVNFASAKKLGRPIKSVALFNENGSEFIEPSKDDLAAARQTLSRDGLRTQQEIPHQKDEIRTVSQMNRTLFDNMLNETFSLKGIKEMSGTQAKSLKELVRSRLFDLQVQQLQKELGDLNRSHRGLHRLLKDVIINDTTGSYGENDLKSIELDEKTGKFLMPLEQQFKLKKFQGLINSMINKNVMLKVEGSSFVQVSGVGAKYNFSNLAKGVKSGIIWTDSYAKSFKDGDVKLNYIRKEGDEVKPAQVIVSQYLRDANGKLVDLSKYITEEKVGNTTVKILNTSKMPAELFQLVGTRIPNQSHPSMLPIEVVGFLPAYMENTIIVPDGITGQMGSDFDVDKLYAYATKFNYKDNTIEKLGANQEEYTELVAAAKKIAKAAGEQADDKGIYSNFNNYLAQAVKNKYGNNEVPKFKVERPSTFELVNYKLDSTEDVENMNEEQLGQLYRDIHWMVLTHPAAYDKITKSIDMPEVKRKVAEREVELEKYGITSDKDVMLPLDFITSINRFNDNRSGKVGVGVFANLISAQADFQDKVLRLGMVVDDLEKENPIKIKLSKKGKVIDLLYLGQPGSSNSFIGKTRNISENLNMMFTESVDNAKNQFLREFNWEEKAMSAIGVFEMLTDADGNAAPIEFVMDLTSQGAIKHLFTLMDQKQDSFGEYDSNAMETAMLEIQSKIAERLMKQGYFGSMAEVEQYLEDQDRDQALDPETLEDMWLIGKAIEAGALSQYNFVNQIEQKEQLSYKDPESGIEYNEKLNAETILEKIAKDKGYSSVRNMMLKYNTVQYDSLNLFKRMEDIGRELNTILGSVYTYTKGIGPNVFATRQKLNQLNKLSGSTNFIGLSNIAGTVQRNKDTGMLEIQAQGEIGASIKHSLMVAQEMYNILFPISSGKNIESIVDILMANQGKNKEELGKNSYINLYDTVFNGIKAYMYTMPELELFQNARGMRAQMINGESSLGKRIVNLAKDPEFKSNGFLKNIEVKQAPRQKAYTIGIRALFGSDIDEKGIISGFYELATSDKEEIRQLAKDLAIYPFLTSDAGNIGRFIPVDYYFSDEDFKKVIGVIDSAYSMHMDDPGAMESLVLQIVQNNPEQFAKSFKYSTYSGFTGAKDNVFKRVVKKLVGKEELKDVNTFTIKIGDFEADSKGKNIADSLKVPLSNSESKSLKEQGSTVNFKYPPYILINDTFTSEFVEAGSRNVNYLYKRVSPIGDPSGAATYERINILGYNGIKEYDFNNPELVSAIEGNNNVEDDAAFQETVPPVAPVQQQPAVSGSNNPAEFINHSGGAALSDTEWDQIGREFGVVKHNHYREPGAKELDSSKLRAAGVKPVNISDTDYAEGTQKATAAFRMMYTDSANKTVRSNYIIRNWAQVKYADAVYALGTIKQPGENASDKAGDNRIAAIPLVKGGTGYAVQMAINEGKPVYVFDGTKQGWYKYDYDAKNFVLTETPTLTKNFAGIGSRTLSTPEVIEKSLQAIRNVYAKTFSQAETTKLKTYTGKIESLQPNQVFVFGSNTEGRHGAGSAKTAKEKFGAKYGQAWGAQGQSFAIITKDLTKEKHPSRTKAQIIYQVQRLYDHANRNSDKEFMVAYSATGKNLNGYSAQEMADMFSSAEIPSNIVFEEGFSKLLNKQDAPVSQGVEISSNSKGLAAALTNPTELAKQKGNLTQSYPVTFDGVTYKDAEEAYQKNKGKYKPEGLGKGSTYDLMVQILEAKLKQHPRLVEEITKIGGQEWLSNATHQPTNKNTVWETGGLNLFINALQEAYYGVIEDAEILAEQNEEQEVIKAPQEDQELFTKVTYGGRNFILEENAGSFDVFYANNNGAKGALVKDKGLFMKVQLTHAAILYPEKVVTIQIGSKENRYYVAFDNRIYSLQPSSYADLITSDDVTRRVMQQMNTPIQEKQVQQEESTTTFNYNGITVPTEFQLSIEQADALKKIIDFVEARTSGDGTFDGTYTLEGYAGTGKTSIIGILDRYMGQKSRATKFLYMAPTHAATVALGNNIVKYGAKELPMTVQASVTESRDPRKPGPKFTKKLTDRATGIKNVIVLDEASMLANKDFEKLVAAAKAEGFKIIFMGDPKQIPEVMPGVKTKELAKAFANPNKSELTTVFRTKDNNILTVLTNIRNNSDFVEYEFENSDNMKQLSRSEYNEELIDDLKNNLEDITIINYTNDGVAKINKAARQVLGYSGPLKPGEKIVGYGGSQTKQIEKGHLANSVSYMVQDVTVRDEGSVVITSTSKALEDLQKAGMKGFPTSASFSYLQLSANDSLDFELTPQQMLNNKKELADKLRKIHELNELYQRKGISYSNYLVEVQTIRMQLAEINTGNRYIFNPAINDVELYDKDKHKGINANLEIDKGVDFGYGITVHKSQGMTIPIVYFDTSSLSVVTNTVITRNGVKFNTEKNALYYVGMSRAAKKLVVPKNIVATDFTYNEFTDGVSVDEAPEVEVFNPLELLISHQKDEAVEIFTTELFGKEKQVTDYKGFLNNLFKVTSPLNKAIITAISKTGSIEQVTFKIDMSQADPGTYNRATRTITINPKAAIVDATDIEDMKAKIHEVIMHELMHHLTVDMLMADQATLSPEQRKWVKAINNLFDQVQIKMLEDPEHSASLLMAMSQMNTDGFLSAKDKSLYYGLTSVYDFVTMMMTDKSFQQFMNTIEVQGDKTVLDRFIDLLMNIIKSLGIQVKDRSALDEGLRNIIGLIGSRTETVQKSIATENVNRSYIEQNFDTIINVLNIKTNC